MRFDYLQFCKKSVLLNLKTIYPKILLLADYRSVIKNSENRWTLFLCENDFQK